MKISWILVLFCAVTLLSGCNREANESVATTKRASFLKVGNVDQKSALSPEKINRESLASLVRVEGSASSGSGVLIGKKNGYYYVATAWHAIKSQAPGEELWIVTEDKRKHKVDIQNIDQVSSVDLGIVRFRSKSKYQVAAVGFSKMARVGDPVYVLGFPLPTTAVPVSTPRFLSGTLIGNTGSTAGNGYQLLYTNPTLPGMSGGPVYSNKGVLIGIHGRAETDITETEQRGIAVKTGTNQAVPIDHILTQYGYKQAEPKSQIEIRVDNHVAIAQGLREQRAALFPLTKEKYGNDLWKLPNLFQSQAIEQLNQAINLRPSADLYYIRQQYSAMHYGVAQASEAPDQIVDLTNAIRLDPTYAAAYLKRGELLSYSLPQKSKSDLEEALRLEPSNELVYIALSNWYDKRKLDHEFWGDGMEEHISFLEKSVDYARKAVKVNPLSAKANYNLAIALDNMYLAKARKEQDTGSPDVPISHSREALIYMEKAYRLEPESMHYLLMLSYDQLNVGDLNGALKSRKKILEVKKSKGFDRGDDYRLIARVYEQLEDHAQSFSYSWKALKNELKTKDLVAEIEDLRFDMFRMARALIAQGDRKKACSLLLYVNSYSGFVVQELKKNPWCTAAFSRKEDALPLIREGI